MLLSDDPAAAGPAVAENESVPPSVPVNPPAGDGDAEADTFPMPVILSGSTAVMRAEVPDEPRGPFDPARSRPTAEVAGPALESTAGSALESTAGSALESTEPAEPELPEPGDSLPSAAAEKLDQIKDLLITAEAIGEANLGVHFERVSQRQRELIREFFDHAIPDRDQRT